MHKGKDIEEYIFWDALQILQLSFRDTITLEKAEFTLQEINGYNPLSRGSVKTKLSYIFPPTQSDADNIVNGETQGIANLKFDGE